MWNIKWTGVRFSASPPKQRGNNMKKAIFLGIDVGGMSLKGAGILADGSIVYKESISTNNETGNDLFVRILNELTHNLVNKLNDEYEIKGLGIGIPGICNVEKLIVEYAPNLKLEKVDIKKALSWFNKSIYISNDANVACLGESMFGASKEYKSSILLTLGTGVGGGVIINGKLFEGNEGKGTELGHMTIKTDGVVCGCGRKGCFEAYASASALLRITKRVMNDYKDSLMWKVCDNDINKVNGLTSFECAKKGDKAANLVIDEYVSNLGEGILNYCNIFRPEAIILGGGISNQGDYLINKLKKYCSDRNYGFKNSPVVELKCAVLKNDAGVIGAASLVMERENG